MGFSADQETYAANYGGGSGYGGASNIILMVVVFVVVFSLLFRDGMGKGGHDGYGYASGPAPYGYAPYGYAPQRCGVCVEDESNWQEDKHLTEKLCFVDRDVLDQGCKDREATHCEGEKTRALIEQNYIQDLRDKLAEKNSEVLTLKSEAFTACEIGKVLAAVGCTNQRIEKIECEIPRRQPVYADCVTPDMHHVDFPRRPVRGFDDGFCCA